MTAISFTVPGKPIPQGSKRHVGHGILIEQTNVGPWRERIAIAAHNAMNGQPMLTGPIHLTAHFVLPRPKAAPKTKPTAPATAAPDLDKLLRALCDALQGSVLHTDAQITGHPTAGLLEHLRDAAADNTRFGDPTPMHELRNRKANR